LGVGGGGGASGWGAQAEAPPWRAGSILQSGHTPGATRGPWRAAESERKNRQQQQQQQQGEAQQQRNHWRECNQVMGLSHAPLCHHWLVRTRPAGRLCVVAVRAGGQSAPPMCERGGHFDAAPQRPLAAGATTRRRPASLCFLGCDWAARALFAPVPVRVLPASLAS